MRTHAVLAAVAQTPELALKDDEAKSFAASYVQMQQHYAHTMSPKTIDTLSFLGVVGTIYGSRIVQISQRNKAAKEAKDKPSGKPAPNNVVPMMSGIPGL